MAQDVQFNNFVFGTALTLMLGYILFIGRPILVPAVTAILLVYVIVGLSRLSGYIPFVGKRIPSQVRYILAALAIALLIIELFTLFVANLTAIVARAPEFQESLLNTLQQGAALIGIESTLTWETVRREVLGEFNLQGMIRTGFMSIAGLLGSLLIAAQMLMGNIIEPQVMGNSLNLSPYVILISLTAWSSLWGIPGAIFSVPFAAIMVIVFSEFERTRPLAILLSLNGQIPARGD